MSRIKVTGYLDTDDLDDRHVDPSHEMGLSEEGYLEWSRRLPLDDIDFKIEEETA
jgi:hypothetical protein